MASLEFVIPEDFLFIFTNLSFISFSFFISFIISKILKSTMAFFILLIALLNTTYYDIFVKYLIKNFYEQTLMDSKIYYYPSKNEGQKIDSLSVINIYNHPLKYSTSLTSIEKDEIRATYENYVERFVDISTYVYKYNKLILNIERVYLNNYKDNSASNERARFTIEKNMEETIFPKLYINQEFKFIDTTNNYVLATAFNITFLMDNHKFRNRYLYWGRQKEEEFNPSGIQNFDNIYKKMFIDDVRGSIK